MTKCSIFIIESNIHSNKCIYNSFAGLLNRTSVMGGRRKLLFAGSGGVGIEKNEEAGGGTNG